MSTPPERPKVTIKNAGGYGPDKGRNDPANVDSTLETPSHTFENGTTWHEASIVINGITLSFAEAMAVRVALTTFQIQMEEPNALGESEQTRKGYLMQLANVAGYLALTPSP